MNDSSYDNEMIVFDACKQYGVEFADVMAAADAGIIKRDEHINSRGAVVYRFRRADVRNFSNGVNHGSQN